MDFYVSHGALMAILRLDVDSGGGLAGEVIAARVKPVFDAAVATIDAWREAGCVRADVDGVQLCISAMGMAAFPFTEERSLAMLSPVDFRAPENMRRRKDEIAATLLSRIEATI